MDKKIKYFTNPAKAVDDEKRVLRFIGSTEDIDRDNEVIKASGWRLKDYRKNPVVLVNHQHYELPVAKTKKVWVDKAKKSLMFDIEFPEPEVSSQGDTLFKLYKGGFMNATSVGFRPNPEKMKFGERKGEPRVTFGEQELLEISLVSVPANPQALLTAKSIQKAIEDEVVDELEINDLMSEFMNILADDELKEEKEEKDEKNQENKKEHLISKNDHLEDQQNINSSEKGILACKSCGIDIECLCPECKKKSEEKEFFEHLYKVLLG